MLLALIDTQGNGKIQNPSFVSSIYQTDHKSAVVVHSEGGKSKVSLEKRNDEIPTGGACKIFAFREDQFCSGRDLVISTY